MKKTLIVMFAAVGFLSACGDNTPPKQTYQAPQQYQQPVQQAPQQYAQPQSEGIGTGTAVLGAAAVGAAAYMLGKNSAEKQHAVTPPPQQVVVQQPYTRTPPPIVAPQAQKPAPVALAKPAAPVVTSKPATYVAPTSSSKPFASYSPKPLFSGGVRAARK